MSRVIAVIGGSGFIGTRLVAQLLSAGNEVRIVDKAPSSAFPELVTTCNVCDLQALTESIRGCDVVYNLAAEHRDDVRPISLYDEVNVGGARNTCAAAEAAGIEQIIFTSSVAVYGFSEGTADESTSKRPFNDYGRTKLEAEKVYEVWQGAASDRRSLTVVRPTVVFGEGNRGNVYNLLRQIARGPFLMIGDGTNQKSMAYVENIAGFLAFALRWDEAGRRVFNYVDKPDFDMNSLVATIRRALGRSERPAFRLPYSAGIVAGGILDLVASLIRRPLPLSRIRVEKFCASTSFSADLALETGFKPPVPLDQALARTLESEFSGPESSRG